MIVEGLAVAEIILLAFAGSQLSKVTGTADTNSDFTKALVPALGLLVAIVLVHTLLWYMYFTYNPISMNAYFMVSGAMSMIISIIALGISLVNKS
jgi:hypothetical protein